MALRYFSNSVRITIHRDLSTVKQPKVEEYEVHSRGRRRSSRHDKRRLILDAARRVFEEVGLEGASLRAIAADAGYTPAALYFHFESKEAVYAELLAESLAALGRAVVDAARGLSGGESLRAAAMAFFDYYANNPRDLDLGFYLLRGGMKPDGLGDDRDRALNAALAAALQPIADAATDMGADEDAARRAVVDTFAHATGLLLLLHTGRIRMFGASARDMMERHVAELVERLGTVRS